MSMQDLHLELEDRHLELDELIDSATALTELSGGEEQVASSIVQTRSRCDALTTAIVVSGSFVFFVSNLNLSLDLPNKSV